MTSVGPASDVKGMYVVLLEPRSEEAAKGFEQLVKDKTKSKRPLARKAARRSGKRHGRRTGGKRKRKN